MVAIADADHPGALADHPDGLTAPERDVASGRWLSIRDAIREIGSLEHLHLLARNGALRSQVTEHGGIEVWVDDGDGFDAAMPPGGGAASSRRSAALGESSPSDIAHEVAALIAPLVESHEHQLQLARENGILVKRLAQIDRELQTLQVAALQSAADVDEPASQSSAAFSERLPMMSRLSIVLVTLIASLLGLGAGWFIASGGVLQLP
jgi:hypothetical protein